MNILVTGAFGFVGTNLSQSLKNELKAQLLALDLNSSQKGVYDLFFSWDDIANLNQENIDVVIHLAGKAHDTKNTTEEKTYFDINVGLTKKIFDFFLESKAEIFIFFSSVKAVADSVPGEILTELDTPNPQTPYGKSKLEAENYILGKQVSEGKKVYVLRPSMIHGPGNKGNLNLLFQIVQKGIPWPLGRFNNQRSFISIQNLNAIIRRILIHKPDSGVYHLADDETISTNRIVELIAEACGKKSRIINLNPGWIQLVARLGDILKLPLNTERLKKLTESYVVSNEKIKRSLGFEKMPFTAEEGLKNTLKSF